MRLHMIGYFQGEYIHLLSREELLMNYIEYSVNSQKTQLAKRQNI